MRKFILILIAIAGCYSFSFAQEKGFTAAFNWNTATNKPFSSKYDFATQNIVIAPGYSFNGRLFARIPVSFTTELYQSEGKTYEMNCYLGGTVGYDIVRNPNIGTIELAATVGGTIFSKTTKYIYYDLGAMWYLGYMNKFGLGLGARYYQAQSTGLKNNMMMTFNIGFRFN